MFGTVEWIIILIIFLGIFFFFWPGIIAYKKGQSFWAVTACSLFLTPVIGLVIALFLTTNYEVLDKRTDREPNLKILYTAVIIVGALLILASCQ